MKKFYFFLLIGIFLFISTEILKSKEPFVCPSGFYQTTVTIPVTENGNTCYYEWIICYKCGVGTYPGTFVIEITPHAQSPVNPLCICSPEAVMNAIVDLINNPDWIMNNISTLCLSSWPPCNGIPPVAPIEVIYSYPRCWYWYTFWLNEEHTEGKTYMVAGCDCFCEWSKFFCWNGTELIENENLAIAPHSDGNPCDCLNWPPWPDPLEGEACFPENSPCTQ